MSVANSTAMAHYCRTFRERYMEIGPLLTQKSEEIYVSAGYVLSTVGMCHHVRRYAIDVDARVHTPNPSVVFSLRTFRYFYAQVCIYYVPCDCRWAWKSRRDILPPWYSRTRLCEDYPTNHCSKANVYRRCIVSGQKLAIILSFNKFRNASVYSIREFVFNNI